MVHLCGKRYAQRAGDIREIKVYTLPQTDDGREDAANWFTAMDDVELGDGPMEFPEGKMSIKTKLMDIYKNEAAWEFVSKMMGGFKLSPEHPMWNMVGNFNLETLMGMNGAPDEKMLKLLNKKLNAFDLVD